MSHKAKRALAVLKSFVTSLKISYGNISLGLDIEPERGTADSGDLEIDLPQLFIAVGEAAKDQSQAIAILPEVVDAAFPEVIEQLNLFT